MMLSSCHDKKKDASAETTAEVMPVTVARPLVETVTLTKTYPGSFTPTTRCRLCARSTASC